MSADVAPSGPSKNYPPEPWRMRGNMSLSLWRVPKQSLPEVPPGTKPVLLGGKGLVGTAWVVYGPGSAVRVYNELFAGVLVTRGIWPRVNIPQIWVDSVPSNEGARALWGVPKEMGTFKISENARENGRGNARETRASLQGIVSATMSDRLSLPGKWPVRLKFVHSLRGMLKDCPMVVRSKLTVRNAEYDVDKSGPLTWLRGNRPFFTLGLPDFDMLIGDKPIVKGE
ncbi:hypothetical protein CBR_g34526 [Chara braunii]|uniref:Acetoacetate decarboxylase n=1 Tax=Chara braunii TaxID=69332 RepID=A0A388LJ26_CHABU|nr:hypothetical protein CBR_g34526 [Chara braunii]|eukprot:GBG82243.1 hypothetical protein CBR_g34526 [Chara braunii]